MQFLNIHKTLSDLDLVRHFTLSADDLTLIKERRRAHNHLAQRSCLRMHSDVHLRVWDDHVFRPAAANCRCQRA